MGWIKKNLPLKICCSSTSWKIIDVFLQYLLYFFNASRVVYIFAWKLVSGKMQLAIVYLVTILLKNNLIWQIYMVDNVI